MRSSECVMDVFQQSKGRVPLCPGTVAQGRTRADMGRRAVIQLWKGDVLGLGPYFGKLGDDNNNNNMAPIKSRKVK
jgi:hypothetical protein